MDFGVFQETTLTDGIYTRVSSGYKFITTLVPSQHRGGVALFYQESPAFAVKAIRQFGTNVIVCQMETGGRRWYITICYLAPGDGTTIRYVEASMVGQPMGADMVVVGDFNVDLERTGGRGRNEEIAAVVAPVVLEDLAGTSSRDGGHGARIGGRGRR